MAGHGPHSATVKLSKGAHVQPMAPWQPLLIRNMEINAQSIMRGLLGNGTMLQNIMRAWIFIIRDIMRNIMRGPHLLCAILCAAPATLQYIMRGLCAPVFYYARHYAQHYARTAHIMREMLILHSALPGCLRRLPYACPTTPPLSTHIMARLSQPMLQTSVVTVKLRRA